MEYSKLRIKDEAFTKQEFKVKWDENGVLQTYPKPENLVEYYNFGDYISHQSDRNTLLTKVYNLVKQHMFKTKLNHLLKNKKELKSVLDYGCGTGEFVEYLESKSIQAEGVEPTPLAFKKAKDKRIKVHKSLDRVQDSFDAITLFHVLEHVDDYESILKQLTKKLKPNGLILIAVPNYKSYDAHYYKEKWAAWDVPRHLWHFSKKNIREIGNRCNLELIQTKGMPFDAFYISMVSESYKGNLKLKGLWHGLVSNLKAIRSKEYSSNLFILQYKSSDD